MAPVAISEHPPVVAEQQLARTIHRGDFLHMKVLGQFNYGFIIARFKHDLYVIDQHAADEKYNYERYRANTRLTQQPLIRPIPLHLSREHEQVIHDHQEIFTRLGFRLRCEVGHDEESEREHEREREGDDGCRDASGDKHTKQDAAIPGVDTPGDHRIDCDENCHENQLPNHRQPQEALTSPLPLHRVFMLSQPSYRSLQLNQQDIAYACEQLINAPSSFLQRPYLPRLDAAFASRACRTSVMIGMPLPMKKLQCIVHNLEGLEHPWSCPHGRATMRHLLDLHQLDQYLQTHGDHAVDAAPIRLQRGGGSVPSPPSSSSSSDGDDLLPPTWPLLGGNLIYLNYLYQQQQQSDDPRSYQLSLDNSRLFYHL